MLRFLHNIKIPSSASSSSAHLITLTHLQFLHKTSSISQNPPNERQQESINGNNNPSSSLTTISYLIKKYGLSPQSALSVSKRVTIKSTEKPDSLLKVFKSYDFTDTQITKAITKWPRLLTLNPNTIIKSKLDFFLSQGYSSSELTSLISSSPIILQYSLEKMIKPNFEILRGIIGTNQQISAAVHISNRLLLTNPETNLLPNVRTLRANGVPEANITKLANMYPRVLTCSSKWFEISVEEVSKMGFDPSTFFFVQGVNVHSGTKPAMWERKTACYKSLGWSDEQVISAFTKQPFCMSLSEEKIRRTIRFFVEEMKLEPSALAVCPVLLGCSLEMRIVPRCLILNMLISKGLLNRKIGVCGVMKMTDKAFVDKFVTKFADRVPEVLEAYKGKSQL